MMFTDTEIFLMMRARSQQRATVRHAQAIVDHQSATIASLQAQLAAARRDVAVERGARQIDRIMAIRARKGTH